MRKYIDEKRLVDVFVELIKVNSPSFAESAIGEVLARMLKRAGCEVEVWRYDRSFNLAARKRGTIPEAPPLLLSGHMDTIEPTEGIEFSEENGIIRTTGDTVLGADDKSALAQILEAVTVLQERGVPHGDVEIVFTSAEEKGLHGAKHVDAGLLRSRHALVLDSSGGVGGIVTSAPTHCTYEMTVTGRPAHAGIEPEKGISAIRVASRIVAAVPDGRIDGDTTANIGVISGGTATNVVPKDAVIRGEVRSRNRESLERVKQTIFETARAVAAEAGAGIRIEHEEEYRAFRIEEDDPFLCYMDGVFRSCGIEPVHVATGGGSDANIFNEKGITTINISTGMMDVHSTGEQIAIHDLIDGCAVVLGAIAGFVDFRG